MRATSIPGISLRAYRQDEIGFLQRLYATTREVELRHLVAWTDAQKRDFVRSQFELQHDYYTKLYPGATFDVVLENHDPIGRFYVYRGPAEIRLMDVTLLPGCRNRGIGGGLTRQLLEEGTSGGTPVVLHVEPWNPALRLYARLGFVCAGQSGVHQRMEWRPVRPQGVPPGQSTGSCRDCT